MADPSSGPTPNRDPRRPRRMTGSVLRSASACRFLLAALLIAHAAAPAAERSVAGSVSPSLEAQGAPPSRATLLDHAIGAGFRVDLPAAAMPEAVPLERGPVRIGFHRDVPEALRGDLLPSLDWRSLGNGAVAAALWVSSPEAKSIRVGVRARLAEGAEVRFFHPNGDGAPHMVTPADFHFPPSNHMDTSATVESREGAAERLAKRVASEPEVLWSQSVEGGMMGIEIMLPSWPTRASWFRVEKVAHRWSNLGARGKEGAGIVPAGTAPALDCPDLHVDVQCRVGEFNAGLEDSVARIVYEQDGHSRVCTGTLLNDKDPDTVIPHFLTANHCVATSEVARTVETWWFYQRERCGVETLDVRADAAMDGAELLVTSPAQDATLLRLRGRVPDGLWLSGWDARAAQSDEAVVGIHHPAGEVKRFAAGTVLGKRDFRDISGTTSVDGSIEVAWHDGFTEGGSSGSGLFRDGNQLIGTLVGGRREDENSCDRARHRAYYAPFADFFPNVCSFLDPDSDGCGGDDHGDSRSAATRVSLPSQTSGEIDPGDDEDHFRFEVPRRGEVLVRTTGSLDTIGALHDSAGRQLATDDDGGAGFNFHIQRELAAGTYYVWVSSYQSETGAYTLHLSIENSSGGVQSGGYRRALGDFNGDGREDVLLRHQDGRWYYYPMNGRRHVAGRGTANLTRNLEWSVAGIGDFDGDGRDDVLLRKPGNGAWYYYPMNGRRHVAGRGTANLTRNLEWSVAGIGDFDGDGRDDVLLRKPGNGAWYYYPMNGRRHVAGRGTANLTRNLEWSVAGIGDFDGDGRDDVLLRKPGNGVWYYYPMNGRRHMAGRGVANLTRNLEWSVAGIGDLNGDGRDDVLLRKPGNGRWYYYPMNGRRHMAGRGVANLTSNLEWSVAGIGDLNGDGRDDVLLRKPGNGRWYYYPMNGRRHMAGHGSANLTSNRAWGGLFRGD